MGEFITQRAICGRSTKNVDLGEKGRIFNLPTGYDNSSRSSMTEIVAVAGLLPPSEGECRDGHCTWTLCAIAQLVKAGAFLRMSINCVLRP